MVQIRNNKNSEVYKLSGASVEFATKDSVIVDRVITNKFRRNWHCVFSHFMVLGSSTQCLLNDGFEVILKSNKK